MKGRAITYSAKELAWIERNATRKRREAHAMFCARFSRADVTLKHFNALCKRKGWLTGRTGCFTKGCIPHNKGKEMPFNANSARTQFKKGRLPHNTKFLGHERVTKDGYVEMSVAETNPHTGFERRYVLKHRHLWEKKNGPLPKGMVLKALDGDRRNTDPSNWTPIPRGALPFLNGHRGVDYDSALPELKPTVLAVAKLKHARTARVRGVKHIHNGESS